MRPPQHQTLLAMLGYLQKRRGRALHRADGASLPSSQMAEGMFKDGKILEMSEQLWFYGRRARAMFAIKRAGAPVKRAVLAESMRRVIPGCLKYLLPFLNVLQKIRLMLINSTLQRIRPHDEFTMNSMNIINPAVLQIMDHGCAVCY